MISEWVSEWVDGKKEKALLRRGQGRAFEKLGSDLV